MSSRRRQHSLLRVFSPRSVASKLTFATLLIGAASLFVLGQSKPGWQQAVRATTNDISASIASFMASPTLTIQQTMANMQSYFSLQAANTQLKAENASLMQWQERAQQLAVENDALRKLQNAVPAGTKHFITVNIVGDNSNAYSQTALLSGGREDGVQLQQAVVNENGLIGRVIEVGESSARMLLITDINSRIPVVGETSQNRAILAGNNNNTLTLDYAPANHHFEKGERIVTSGDGGMIPAGLPVAVVDDVDGGHISAKPYTNWQTTPMVSVIDYQF